MRKPPPNGTPVYARQHSRTPTLPQLNAIDLLAAGSTDSEAAGLLTVTLHLVLMSCHSILPAATDRARTAP
jgi:hypothetical protein